MITEKDIIEAYTRIRTIDNTIPDEVLDFIKNASIKQLRIGAVRSSSWIKFEETKFVEDGIYPIKTNEGRIISAERFKGSWMEYDTPIKENESVVSYYA